MNSKRSQLISRQNEAADQQPWRCGTCNEPVSRVNPRPCACQRGDGLPTTVMRAEARGVSITTSAKVLDGVPVWTSVLTRRGTRIGERVWPSAAAAFLGHIRLAKGHLPELN